MTPSAPPPSMFITQKELLLDIGDAASSIEEEFSAVFKPYEKGWYRRQDEHPVMPNVNKKGETLFYHMKGGTLLAPWDEQVTLVTDPNTADRSIYDSDGNMVVEIIPPPPSRRFNHPPQIFFTQRPTLPVHGLKILYEYVNYFLDRSCLWQTNNPPLSQYLKHLFDKKLLEESEVVEIEYTLLDTQQKPNSVPNVIHSNAIMDALVERLNFHCRELEFILDAFVGVDTWQTYSVLTKAHIHLHLKKLGDYRILEWTRLKNEGKI